MYKILNELDRFKDLGEQQLSDGTLLIGKAPHIAPQAWLHCIHAPLNVLEIEYLEEKMGLQIPIDYKLFLTHANGVKFFNTTLSLDGFRKVQGRSINDVWQPFDITTINGPEKPRNARSNMFFIGGYDWDGSLLYIDSSTSKVHLCNNLDSTSLYEWGNFNEMLESEILRLIALFDKMGKEIDPNKSTLPYIE